MKALFLLLMVLSLSFPFAYSLASKPLDKGMVVYQDEGEGEDSCECGVDEDGECLPCEEEVE